MKRWLFIALVTASCTGPAPTMPSALGTESPTITQRVETGGEAGQVALLDDSIEVDDPAAAAKTFTLTGVVTDKAYSAWKISTATVMASPGGKSAKTSSSGLYTLKLPAGTYTLRITKSGYTTASIRKSFFTASSVPMIPAIAAG